MKSAGEATPEEVRDGHYNANVEKPKMTFEQMMKEHQEHNDFGGVVGRSEGDER